MLSRLIAIAFVSIAAVASAAAQPSGYPDKTIKVIVPFAAGGGIDVMARLYAEKAKDKLGVPIIVENRPGASATIGGQAVHQSPPDGYTLLFVPITHVMANVVLKSVPYDAVNDFTPVARVGKGPLMVVISPNLPQKTLAEVAAAARERGAYEIGTAHPGGAGADLSHRGRVCKELARIGVLRGGENVRGRSLLLDASVLEHDDPVRQHGGDAGDGAPVTPGFSDHGR